MITVWKYELATSAELAYTHERDITMPSGAIIRSVQVQRGAICLWAEVDADAQTTIVRTFRLFCTGQRVETTYMTFVATVQATPFFVVHVYEKY